MLRIYHSTDRIINQDHLLKTVCDHCTYAQGLQLILVPEQISHMLERKLCEYGGDKISQYAEILGFSRLAVRVFSEYGGIAETETDAAGKLLTMSLAVEQLRSRLKLYGSKALKPNFLLQLSQTLDELRSSCISPETLRQKISSLEGALAVKMEELALLLEGYDGICANLGQNPESRLSRLLMALEQNEFARDKTFYFYGFTDFNGIELEIIQQLLADGADVNVYLLCDHLNSDQQRFRTAAATGRDLARIAHKTQTPYEVLIPDTTKTAEGMIFLRDNLFSSGNISSDTTQQVRFLSATDVAGECRMVGGEILRLLEQGVRLRDITVACADYASYKAPLSTVLRRAEIPAYFAGDADILKQPVVHMLLTALEAAMGGEQETVLGYMKTGFSGLTLDEADKLENYVLLWDIDGLRFEETWTMSTQGLQEEKESLKEERLRELNLSREKLMKPLIHLKRGLKSATNTGQMLLALNDFMEEIALNDQLNRQATFLADNQEKQKAQEYAQVYGIICRLMEQMYGVLGQTPRSEEDFFLLFRTAVGLYTVGTIPATIDCVNVGSFASQRNCETPYLFVVGANEGAFPSVQGNTSLLSDRERQLLVDLEIGISPNTLAMGKLNREIAIMDSVLAGPLKCVCFSAVQGRESHFYIRAQNLYPNGECIDDDTALLCRSRRDYEAKYDKPESYTMDDLSDAAVKALYGETLRLSASKLEIAASCRFDFFLRYGLRAKESLSAEVDASIYGTFVHDVLERTCKKVMAEGGFRVVALDRVMELADGYMERFAQEELSDLWHSERAEYLFRRNFHEVRCVVKNLYEELSRSLFDPRYFELNFSGGRKADIPAVPVEGNTVSGFLDGKVDRVDLWKNGDRTYYRVVDYKTGHTTFDYTNVFYGMGLQMLIYLFALKDYGQNLGQENLTPAGVLYFPAKNGKISIDDRHDTDSIEKERAKEQKRTGLVLNNLSVLQAMDLGGEFAYLPCKEKKGELSGDIASAEDLGLLQVHVSRCVSDLADSIYSGKLEPNPYYVSDDRNGCVWCPFNTICGESVNKRILEKMKADTFWERIRKEAEDGEN